MLQRAKLSMWGTRLAKLLTAMFSSSHRQARIVRKSTLLSGLGENFYHQPEFYLGYKIDCKLNIVTSSQKNISNQT